MIDGKRKKVLSMAWALAMYYSQKNFAVSREVGLPYLEVDKNHFWTKQRADFMAVNKGQEVVIVETKSCWSDFATDHSSWLVTFHQLPGKYHRLQPSTIVWATFL